MSAKFFGSIGLAGLAAILTTAAAAQDAPGHPVPGQIGLQPSVTPIMDSIHVFHDGILLWTAVLITLLVLALLVIVMVRFNAKANPTPSKTTHNTLVEVVWTVVPIIILVVIAIPSFSVLTDQLTIPDGDRPGANIFSFGEVECRRPADHQGHGPDRNWDYEYVDQGLSFNSAILTRSAVSLSRRISARAAVGVNYQLVVPVDTTIRMQVTSDPTGDPLDGAVRREGRRGSRQAEQTCLARKTGVYYGQCSELCGQPCLHADRRPRRDQDEFAFDQDVRAGLHRRCQRYAAALT